MAIVRGRSCHGDDGSEAGLPAAGAADQLLCRLEGPSLRYGTIAEL